MNIKRAKEEIINTVKVYLSKDEFGAYKIPSIQQRPILLMGPPGIGKTAIMEQAARECNIGLVSYTITHHTRQSAIGLPFIEKKVYNGTEYAVTEYTMSEIIASVYDKIEKSGKQEGILFIDEINCVSETLAPTMLQFLQGKQFGNHKVPQGWVIVSAGNPPEYNKSVREFDVVTLDRVKKIDVEEDFNVWKEYAVRKNIHGSILSYLEIKKENFYVMETTVDGKSFVTARGWEDLSQMIVAYESLGLVVDEHVICQYLQHGKIAKDFANYYDLYNKYKNDYQVNQILAGEISQKSVSRVRMAPFDEKLSVIGLLSSALTSIFMDCYRRDRFVATLYELLKKAKSSLELQEDGRNAAEIFKVIGFEKEKEVMRRKEAAKMDQEEEQLWNHVEKRWNEYLMFLQKHSFVDDKEAFRHVVILFQEETKKRQAEIDAAQEKLNYAFEFLELAFGPDQEMVIFITELNSNFYCMKFISENGHEKFFQYNKELLFQEKQRVILDEMKELEAFLQEF